MHQKGNFNLNTMKKILLLLLFMTTGLAAQTPEFTVSVKGKGEPILLFPGFTCTEEVWKETVDQLSKNYECHSFTFAGFGGVDPISMPWLPKIKSAIEKYIVEKNLKKPSIIGHSLGGTLALWLSSSQPDLYKKILIVDALPSVGALMVPNFQSEQMTYENPYSKRQLEMDDEAFKAMASQTASFMSLNKDRHQQLTDWILTSDRKTYVYGYVDLLKLDLRSDISKIQIPVKVLAATYPNKAMVAENYQKQYKELKNVQIDYADGSAHFIMFDKPDWYKKQISDYFDLNE